VIWVKLSITINQEKLAATGVRFGCFRHGKDAATVGQLREVLIRHGITGPTLTGTGWVTALEDLQALLGAESMAEGVGVESLPSKAEETIHRARCECPVQRQADVTCRGGECHASRSG